MELTAVQGPSILVNTLQHSLPGTILYPTKNSPWQPVVAPLPCLTQCTEIPKETIIANTDFTTTSVLAKRRLSSKKRKQQQQQQKMQERNSVDESSSQSSSPVVKMEANRLSWCSSSSSPSSTSSAPQSSMPHIVHQHNHTHTHTHHIAAAAAAAAAASHQYGVPLIPIGTTGVPVSHQSAAAMYGSDVASLRVLQEQGTHLPLLPLPHHAQQHKMVTSSSASNTVTQSSSSDTKHDECAPDNKSSDFKWCSAHIFIAKRIKEHQNQKHMTAQHGVCVHTSVLNQEALQQQQQQQQQLAMLQMYGCLPTMPGVIAAGPMAAGLTEAQMQQLVSGGVMTSTAPPHQMMGVQIPAMYPTQTMPLAVSHVDSSVTLLPGQNVSWATPALPVIGPCVVNPVQPGMLVNSWVK